MLIPMTCAGGSIRTSRALPRVSGSASPQINVHRIPEVVNRAQREAGAMGDEYVSVEHLLLAIADRSNTDRAGDLLRAAGAEPAELRAARPACAAASA